jgi:hypothetical protein
MRKAQSAIAYGVAILLMLIGSAQPSNAVFHITVIDEVMTSYGGNANVQFIEMRMLAVSQNAVAHSVFAVFDSTGTYTGDLLAVPGNVANAATGSRWLIGTSAFQTASGLTPDFPISTGILPTGGGMVCFGGGGGIIPDNPPNWSRTDFSNYVDCVAYGNYSGPTNTLIGTATTLTGDGHSLQRTGNTHNNANDFACANPATPQNNAGTQVSLAATSPCTPPTATPSATRTATGTRTPSATPTRTPALSGQIRYYSSNGPVPGVSLSVPGATPGSTTTDGNGMFRFASVPPGMMSLQPSKQGDFNFDVTALDAAYVLQFVAGLRDLSDDQKLAADVTGNGSVSALDAARILQFQAGLLGRCSVTTATPCTIDTQCPPGETCKSRFPVAQACGSDWVFRPVAAPAPNQTLVMPQINSSTCQRGAIDYSVPPLPLSGQDFIAILFGDTTGNWTPPH